MVGRNRKRLFRLNQIQQQVMDLVVDGRTVSEVSATVGLSEITVSIIINSAVGALDANSLAHAAIIYHDQKLNKKRL